MKRMLAACFAILLFFCACAQPVQTPASQEASSSIGATSISSKATAPDASSTSSEPVISPMLVLNPPLVISLPEPDENGFGTFPISIPPTTGFRESYLLSLPYKDGIYWLDDNRAVFIEAYNLYCLDLKTSEMKILLATDLTNIWSEDIPRKPKAERFLLTGASRKPEMTSSLDDGFFFGDEKKYFIIPTYIPGNDVPYRFHAFSCADFSPLDTISFDTHNLSEFPLRILCVISSRGNLANIDIYNGVHYRSDDPQPLQIRSLIHSECGPKNFQLKENCEYQSWGNSISPSGDYYILINLTKSQKEAVHPYSGAYPTDPIYFDIFDCNGEFYSEICVDHWLDTYFVDQFYWDSGHDGKAKVEMCKNICGMEKIDFV